MFFFCLGRCSALGEMLYKTFSNELYHYQSYCEYVLVAAKNGTFLVTIQNQPCRISNNACFKNLRIIQKKKDGSYMKISLLAGMDLKVDGVAHLNNKYKDDYLEVRPIGALWVSIKLPKIKMTIIFDQSESRF